MDPVSLRSMTHELSQNEKLGAALKRVKEKGQPVTVLFPKLAYTLRDVGVATAGLGAAGGALGAARAHQKGESKSKGALKGALIGGAIPAGLIAAATAVDKVATAGHGPPPHQYEEMNKAKWKQTLKDLPVALLGTGVGYGLGRTASEYLVPHMFSSPQSQSTLKKLLPAAAAAGGGLSSFMLSMQRRALRDRREQAARESGGTMTAEAELTPTTVAGEVPPKTAGAPAPAVAQARLNDPWRTDRRYRAP